MHVKNKPVRVMALLAVCAGVTGLTGAHCARAIAPSDQIIYTVDPNAGGTSFPIGNPIYAAVEVVASDGSSGTGSVVGKYTSNGNLYFEVLTAAHVVDNGALVNGNIGYGSPQPPNALAAPMDPYQVVATGGSTGKEDMALLAVNVGPTTNIIDLGFYGLMTPLTVTPYAVPNPYTSQSLGFTEIGYGRTGTAQNFAGVPGYTQTIPSGGTKMFQNNKVNAITTPTSWGSYTYQGVEWLSVAPANNNGTGTSFAGDSGGPYLMSTNAADQATVNVYGRPGGTVAIPITTNGLFAIHTAGYYNAPNIKMNASLNRGELITNADLGWINTNIGNTTPVPEPAALALLAVGGVMLLLRKRQFSQRS